MKKQISKIGAILVAVLMIVGLLPTTAFAEVTSLPDDTSERVLNIYKYSPITENGTPGDGTVDDSAATDRVPLQDVEFEIYRIPEGQETSATPSEEEIAAIAISDNRFATVITGEDGLASYNFGAGTENDGKYLVMELPNPAVAVPVDPFYVNIPLTNPDEDAWLYTVTVYPKNDVPTGPSVDKDVNEIENNSATHDIGDIQTWIIRGDVPADLWRTTGGDAADVYAKNYSFTDELNTALTYQGNLSIDLMDKSGTEIALTAGTHYVTDGTTATEGAAGGTIQVALTETGMKYVMQNLGSGKGTPEIRVYFDTAINDTAELATEIPNDVTLDYTSSANHTYEPTTVPDGEIPEVHTGGLALRKISASSSATPLADATFKIAREATDEEKAAGSVETIRVLDEFKEVVFVDFYNTDAIEGGTVTETVTNENGIAILNGLSYGTYYLVETVAPDGYNLLSAPVEVTIGADSHRADNAIVVTNSAKFILPVTGGAGTTVFTLGGLTLVGFGLMTILFARKKKAAAK